MAIINSRAVGVDTFANRPAAATAGRLFFASDTNTLYVDTGAAWTTVLVGATTWTTTTSNTTAFNALDPLTTKGDIITHDGTDSVRRAAPSDGYVLIADSAQTSGWRGDQLTFCVTLFAAGATKNFAPGASYVGLFTTGTSNPTHTKINFAHFREARLHSHGGIQIGSTQVDIKVRDTTNSKDVTGVISFTSTTLSQQDTGWSALDAATYGGVDAEIEVQAVESSAGDTGRFDNVILELR